MAAVHGRLMTDSAGIPLTSGAVATVVGVCDPPPPLPKSKYPRG